MTVPDAEPVEPTTANKNLRVLIVEDLPTDAELLVRELQRFGYVVTYQRVIAPGRCGRPCASRGGILFFRIMPCRTSPD